MGESEGAALGRLLHRRQAGGEFEAATWRLLFVPPPGGARCGSHRTCRCDPDGGARPATIRTGLAETDLAFGGGAGDALDSVAEEAQRLLELILDEDAEADCEEHVSERDNAPR